MKKTKLFGLTTLLLTLGLTACLGPGESGGNGGGGNGGGGTEDGDTVWVTTNETHYQINARGERLGAAQPHTLVDYEGDATNVNVPATCKSPGLVYKKCTVCEKIVPVDVKKLNHEYEEIPSEDNATCTKAGTTVYECKLCGDKKTEKNDKPLGHHMVAAAATGKAGVTKSACDREGCGAVEYVLDVSQATGWNKATTKMNAKSGADSMSTWDVAGVIVDGKYDIQVEGLMSYTSHGDRYWYNMYETDTASSPDTADQDPFRYFFKVNDATINPNVLDKTWSDLGYKGENDSGTPVYGDICKEVTISGANTFSLVHGNIGFSMIISKIKLTKVD